MIRLSRPSFILIGGTVLFLCACSRVTSQNIDKIKVGMTSDQVKVILGQPNDSKTQGALGLSSTTFTYKKGSSEVTVVFLNDKVMAKNGEFK